MTKTTFQLALCSLFLIFAINSKAQLPYFQGFENTDTSLQILKSTQSISGAPNWSVEISDAGRLRTYVNSDVTISGQKSMSLDSRPRQRGVTYATLTLDLEAYKKARLELSLDFFKHGISTTSRNQDRFMIRGDSNSAWIEIYNWGSERQGYRNLSFSIDSIFASQNQTFGKSFQFRVGVFSRDAISRNSGLTIDNIRINKRYNNEALVKGINNFCTDSTILKTTIYNKGLNQIKTASISWWVNGQKQKSYQFKGNVNTNKSQEVSIGKFKFPSGENEIKILVDSVNGIFDSVRNDTFIFNALTGMIGNYTVKSNGGDFNSIQQAINQLAKKGMCGDVVLQLSSETYNEALIIPVYENNHYLLTIKGVDSSNTIITNADNSKPTIKIEGGNILIEHCNLYSDVDNSISIIEANPNREQFKLSLRNCQVTAKNINSAQYVFGANISSQGVLDIANCLFNTGLKGEIRFSAASINFNNNNISSSKNITITSTKYLSINNNITKGFLNATTYDTAQITKNIITNTNTALRLNSRGNHMKVFNNMILSKEENALEFTFSENIALHHNTIKGKSGIISFNSSNHNIQNNIICATSGFALSYDYTNFNSDAFSALKNNLFYTEGNVLITANSTNFNNIADWQNLDKITIGKQFNKKPDFVSATDLHLTGKKTIPKAAYISGIDTDIDGDPRCKYAVTIGADEVDIDPPIKMQFPIADTVFASETFLLKDTTSNNSHQTYFLRINNKIIDSFGEAGMEHTINSSGTYHISITAKSCTQADSIIKTIEVIVITKAPKASFTPRLKVIDLMETVVFNSQTENGVSEYHWSVEPSRYKLAPEQWAPTFEYILGTDSNSKNPVIRFLAPGKYSTCLMVKNKIDDYSICYSENIIVRDIMKICVDGFSSTYTHGKLIDPHGKSMLLYNTFNCAYNLDIPCVSSITLYFDEFEISNKDNCRLKIFAGSDSAGIPLHNYISRFEDGINGDKNQTGFKDSLVIDTNKVFIKFEFSSSFIERYNGFEIRWAASQIDDHNNIDVDFVIPDSICTETPLYSEPISTNTITNYEWIIAGGNSNEIRSNSENLNEIIFFSGTYTITLIAKNCFSSDTVVKEITVVEPTKSVTPKITISNAQPLSDEIITISNSSSINGYNCGQFTQWQISPNSYTIHYGDLNSRVIKVAFHDTICHDISLITRNIFGQDSLLIKCAVDVLSLPKSSRALYANTVNIYPNPATNQIFIDNNKYTELCIYDLNGKLIYKQGIKSGLNKVMVAELKKGIYIARLFNGNRISYQQKIVIE
jgi:PKD repeat protein